MQVLGWQCRMVQKHTLNYEDLALNNNTELGDSALEETQEAGPMVASPVPGPPPAALLEETVLAGFRDCSEEAIRYLVDVEHLSEDDPLVLGLKQHLWDKQQHLDIPRILGGCCGLTDLTRVLDSMSGLHYDQCRTGLNHPTVDSQSHTQQSADCHCHGGHQCLSQQDGLACPHESPMEEGDMDSSFQQHNHSSTHTDTMSPNTDSSYTTVGLQQHHTPHITNVETDITNNQQDSDPVSVMDLALLAQNNPAIASLTEEILSLLGASGGLESDFESDLDLDHEDQGHTSD